MLTIVKSKYFLTLITLFVGLKSFGQTEWKNWNSLKLNLSLTKKLDLQFSHLRSYDIKNNYSSDFNQSSVQFDYDFTKRVSLSGGAVLGSLSAADGANRLVLRGTFKIHLADALTWSNSIQGEVHSSNETRYRYRGLYITRLGTKKRLNFLRLSPSVSYSLYYNIGGNQIQYYDKSETPVVRQSPDGFHRGRLSVNLNSKINNHLSFSLFCMMQQEFNLFSGEYRKMNIVNPTTGKTVRPFENYNVIGATLSFDFKLYKKKSKSKKKNPDRS